MKLLSLSFRCLMTWTWKRVGKSLSHHTFWVCSIHVSCFYSSKIIAADTWACFETESWYTTTELYPSCSQALGFWVCPHPVAVNFPAVSSHWSLCRLLLTRVKAVLGAACRTFSFKLALEPESGMMASPGPGITWLPLPVFSLFLRYFLIPSRQSRRSFF